MRAGDPVACAQRLAHRLRRLRERGDRKRSWSSERYGRCIAWATSPPPTTPIRIWPFRFLDTLSASWYVRRASRNRHLRASGESIEEANEHGAPRTAGDAERLLGSGRGGGSRAYAARTLGRAGRAAGATQVSAGGVTLNWLTWSDHYFSNQLQKVKGQIGVARSLAAVHRRLGLVHQGEGAAAARWDISSEDALWVPKFYKEGLIVPFDIKSFPVSKQLYSVALNVPFWKAGSNQMGYPFGWSSLQIYYNPKYVTTKPDSYHALLDPKYKKKIVLENQPTDLMAMAGLATGAKKPYWMTTAEIARAKAFLK